MTTRFCDHAWCKRHRARVDIAVPGGMLYFGTATRAIYALS
jgi:hypothetical protein